MMNWDTDTRYCPFGMPTIGDPAPQVEQGDIDIHVAPLGTEGIPWGGYHAWKLF
jgi:hypothetical protein